MQNNYVLHTESSDEVTNKRLSCANLTLTPLINSEFWITYESEGAVKNRVFCLKKKKMLISFSTIHFSGNEQSLFKHSVNANQEVYFKFNLHAASLLPVSLFVGMSLYQRV